VTDPLEVIRLAQWPVAIGPHDVWRFVGLPHLVDDLGFPDRTILAGSQDGVVRPDEAMNQLWTKLVDWPIERVALRLPGNFYDSGQPKLVLTRLPGIPPSAGAEEGDRVWKLQLKTERDPATAREAKRLNIERYGSMTCEACRFAHSDSAMFDARHPTPLAVGKRTTLPEHLLILCPTCHRRAHRKSRLDPFQLHELRTWVASGRPQARFA
jgi:5-methylcytosine-specific restriction protein A